MPAPTRPGKTWSTSLFRFQSQASEPSNGRPTSGPTKGIAAIARPTATSNAPTRPRPDCSAPAVPFPVLLRNITDIRPPSLWGHGALRRFPMFLYLRGASQASQRSSHLPDEHANRDHDDRNFFNHPPPPETSGAGDFDERNTEELHSRSQDLGHLAPQAKMVA